MPRETVNEKALRYIKEGRLNIERVDVHGGVVVASCQGDTGEYMCGYDVIVKQWRCTCPEMKGLCSHLAALRMVVKRP